MEKCFGKDRMENLYEVEEILSDRYLNNKQQFYVKWKGFSSKDNSWVFIDDMKCQELIKQYLNNKPTKTRTITKISINNLISRNFKQVKETYNGIQFSVKPDQKIEFLEHEIHKKYLNPKLTEKNPFLTLQYFQDRVQTPDDVPKKIAGIKRGRGGKVEFQIIWSINPPTYLTFNEANALCPQLLTSYFLKKAAPSVNLA